MQFHELKPIHLNKKKKRIGRGGKRGTYSGRGLKGQKSRSGAKFQPEIRYLIKRYPKKRGYRQRQLGKKVSITNVGVLEKRFNSGDLVSPKTLVEKKIIRRLSEKNPLVKILGQGDLKKALVFKDCLLSDSARAKVEKSGSKIILKTAAINNK